MAHAVTIQSLLSRKSLVTVVAAALLLTVAVDAQDQHHSYTVKVTDLLTQPHTVTEHEATFTTTPMTEEDGKRLSNIIPTLEDFRPGEYWNGRMDEEDDDVTNATVTRKGKVPADPFYSTKHFNIHAARSALFYSKASFCPMDKIKWWNCGPSCKYHPNFTPAAIIESKTGVAAYVGYDSKRSQIIVAFRGSKRLANEIADAFVLPPTLYTMCPHNPKECFVHTGFYISWKTLDQHVKKYASTLNKFFPAAKSMVFTGHGFGAAVALLGATDLIQDYTTGVPHNGHNSRNDLHRHILPPVQVYTFGQPRVGSNAFVKHVAKLLPSGKQFRVTHRKDPIVHLPLRWWLLIRHLYTHTPNEVFFNNDADVHWTHCNDSPIKEDKTCSIKTHSVNQKRYHQHYLGHKMVC